MVFLSESRDIMIVGDSVTAGVGPSSSDKAYYNLVQDARPLDSFHVHSELNSDVDDWPGDVGTTLQSNQDVIILQLGINLWRSSTSSATFKSNCQAFFELLRQYNPISQIYFIRGWMPATAVASQIALWTAYEGVLAAFASDIYVRPFTFVDMKEDNLELYYASGQSILYNDIGHQLLADRLLSII